MHFLTIGLLIGFCSFEYLASFIPFSYLFSGCKDLILIDLIEPVHSQSIGLVASDRDPMPPLAQALLQCAARVNFDEHLAPGNVAAA